MGVDIKELKSHPNKLLLDHVKGVKENVEKLTNSRIAKLAAIFHDLGKINPNFQEKLNHKINKGYSNHSYLSAYIFFCAFCTTEQGQKSLKEYLSVEELNINDIIALVMIIAKHHSDIPDFQPQSNYGIGVGILSKAEIEMLFQFIDKEKEMPINDTVNHFFCKLNNFSSTLYEKRTKRNYLNIIKFCIEKNTNALEFFLDTQFAFASLIHADKADAGGHENAINSQLSNKQEFYRTFTIRLKSYLSKLNQDSKLNKLRTKIRENAVLNIQKGLTEKECVFELTAPTGSGKTLMLLNLASEIIQRKGEKRIIYALPFLSIIEQTEAEVLKIFKNQSQYIQRIDSRSKNEKFETLQKELENSVTIEKLQELNVIEFQESTFAYPFVITTFVRFFETLLSNKNLELLKLSNFSNSIFLIDEIQSLPPRLYGFFVAYLTKFCRKFNSYAIISTATQPNFELPKENIEVKNFFKDYTVPKPLLPLKYFENDLFNRYTVHYNERKTDLDILTRQINLEKDSILIILNTINASKELYKKLKKYYNSEELLLLNTHFTVRHRNIKIYLAKRRLRQNKRVIVISTQLIEAGVDIDFPIVYRDFATISSIVQSAGRCNRNGKLPSLGKVVLFRLEINGKIDSNLIYKQDPTLLDFTKRYITKENYQEKELLHVQQGFFNKIQSDLNYARHSQKSPSIEFDFIKDIKECMFEKIGKFQLIDKQLFGEEFKFYIPHKKDSNFELLLHMHDDLNALLKSDADISTIKQTKYKIRSLLRKMSNQIVQIRLKKNQMRPGHEAFFFDLYKIDLNYYSFENGIDLDGSECII